MRIYNAAFITSASKPGEYPVGDIPEVAFCGRSNVGKSSLMNELLGRRRLVKTSKTPGKTRRINFFDADGRLRMVDLPGYGYAKVPQAERKSWKPMIETYLAERRQLGLSVLLVDIRHAPQKLDLEMQFFFRSHQLPFTVVATKADKLKANPRRRALSELRKVYGPGIIPFSVPLHLGKKMLWSRIFEFCLVRASS